MTRPQPWFIRPDWFVCPECGDPFITAQYRDQHQALRHNDVIAAIRSQVPDHPLTADCPDMECLVCGMRDCPEGEPMHYHHDGCPQCDAG